MIVIGNVKALGLLRIGGAGAATHCQQEQRAPFQIMENKVAVASGPKKTRHEQGKYVNHIDKFCIGTQQEVELTFKPTTI